MKKITLLVILLSTSLFSQVGVGTTSPNAQLDVIASNQATPSEKDGILIPRIDEFPATNPSINQDGMIVFVTGDGAPKRGFYYWNKTAWKPFVRKINDLEDGKSNEASVLASVYLGAGAGAQEGGAKSNVGVGREALSKVVGGSGNVAIGMLALRNNTAHNNVAVGKEALSGNTTGAENVALGYKAMLANKTQSFNTVIGSLALTKTLGANSGNNIAIGRMALRNLTSGQNNVVIGNEARGRAQNINATSGTGNVAVGYKSMNEVTSGNNNTALGQYTFLSGTYSNSTALGSSTAISADNQIRLGNGSVSSIGGEVGWTTLSDARFKKDINEDVKGLNFILKLRPVTYHLDIEKINRYIKSPDVGNKDKEYLKAKAAKEKEVQSGFLAQEVEKAAKELGYEFSGVDKPKNENDYYGLRYGQFVTPLVKGMQEQQKMIEELQKEVQALKELIKSSKK